MIEPQRKVYWYEGFKSSPNKCESNTTFDVAIVGGGMAGLMCAKKLIENSQTLKIAIIEATWCGGGASGKSSGFITPDSELELSKFIHDFGVEQARVLWNFAKGGVSAIEETIKTHTFQCDYQKQNSLFIARTSHAYKKDILSEFEAQKQGGYKSILHNKEQVSGVIGSSKYFGAVEYGETFGMNSFKFCQCLKKLLQSKGVKVFEQTPATSLAKGQVRLQNATVFAQTIVVATDRFLPDLNIQKSNIYHTQTFLSLSKPLEQKYIDKLFPSGPKMAWDTDLIYQYFRITGDNRLLFGTANLLYTYLPHEKNPGHYIINKIRKYIKTYFPYLPIEIEYIWPGLIGISKDFMPIAGKHTEIPDVFFIGGTAGLPWGAALAAHTPRRPPKLPHLWPPQTPPVIGIN
jgi:gamma-glutamylputrescine oxidase